MVQLPSVALVCYIDPQCIPWGLPCPQPPELAEDFDRILDHLAEHAAENPGQRIGEIIAALDILEQNPLIGRPVSNAKRELVIGRRSHGYVALYRYVPEIDTVFVLAIRS